MKLSSADRLSLLACVTGLALLAIFFAAALLGTGSLITPIVMHMVFNAGNLLLVAAASQG